MSTSSVREGLPKLRTAPIRSIPCCCMNRTIWWYTKGMHAVTEISNGIAAMCPPLARSPVGTDGGDAQSCRSPSHTRRCSPDGGRFMMRASESSVMTRAWPALLGWVVTCAVALVAGGCVAAQEQQPRDATWFEGARLIDGNGGAPVERSAFVVEDGIVTWVGAEGEREAPEGAARVDLTGKTVIPALIDAHQHLGLTSVTEGTLQHRQLQVGQPGRPSGAHGLSRRRGNDEPGAGGRRDAGVRAAERAVSARGALSDIGPRHRGDADGWPAAGVPPRDPARSADRGGGAGGGRGAAPARGRHHQDLGRRLGAVRCRSWHPRSTGRSSTRRTPVACG